MTVVGKILVFLNLVFSLVVGGFAAVDYASRTQWAKAFDEMNDQNKKLRSIAESYSSEAKRLSNERKDLYDQLSKFNIDPNQKDQIASQTVLVLKAKGKEIEGLKETEANLRRQLKEEKDRIAGFQSMERAMKADAERRTKDSLALRETLKTEMEKNFNLEKEKNELNDKMVTAQIAARTLKDRNTQMETQVQDLARNLAQMKANTGASAVGGKGANPPPENIEGQVTKSEGRLVSISVGADNGLTKGQTMEIFRLGQNPRYIGRIRLTEVLAKSAVGSIEGKTTMTVQSGDKVASRILGGY